MSSVVQGFGFGAGSSMARAAVGSVMGGMGGGSQEEVRTVINH